MIQLKFLELSNHGPLKMNQRNLLAAIAALTLSATSSFAAKLDESQLIKDCKHEAVAVGFTGADVDSYVIECVEEFHETEIINTKLPPKK